MGNTKEEAHKLKVTDSNWFSLSRVHHN